MDGPACWTTHISKSACSGFSLPMREQWARSCCLLRKLYTTHSSGGRFNNMDMLTIGKGGMLEGQYRAEVFLCVVQSVWF
jgi:hypothetical protein